MKRTSSSIFLIDKGPGVTSFEALKTLKRTIGPKVGHAGTLDKFASGLLVCFSGSFTKLCDLFMDLDKVYEATIRFGRQTDTLDPEGEVVSEKPVPDNEAVLKGLEDFPKLYMQSPPLYSAVHINGKRAYEMARDGQSFETKSKEVQIKDFKVMEQGYDYLRLSLKVSKGFYVRSFARDFALSLGSCGYLTQLRRLSIGPFVADNAVAFDNEEEIKKISLQSVSWFFNSLGCTDIEVSPSQAKALEHGNLDESLKFDGLYRLLYQDKLLWVAKDKKLVCQGNRDE